MEKINKEDFKNILGVLEKDEKYQQLMNSIKDEKDKIDLSNLVNDFMSQFQEGLFNPLIEAENDADFIKELSKSVDLLIGKKEK